MFAGISWKWHTFLQTWSSIANTSTKSIKKVPYALVIVPAAVIKRPCCIFSVVWNLKLKTTPNYRSCSTSNGHASLEPRALLSGKPYLYPTYQVWRVHSPLFSNSEREYEFARVSCLSIGARRNQQVCLDVNSIALLVSNAANTADVGYVASSDDGSKWSIGATVTLRVKCL